MRFSKPGRSKTVVIAGWFVLSALVFGAIAYPIATVFSRSLVIAMLILWIGVTAWVARRSRIIVAIIAVMLIAAAGLVVGPGRRFDSHRLADRYATELFRYQGTRYVWGGENRLGIDCSGLVRIALVNAILRQGIFTVNPSLIRSGLQMWWHDQSADNLGKGGDGTTVSTTSADSINAIDDRLLAVGDLAVTASGVHVLAYAGNHIWVEADPNIHQVIAVSVPDRKNPWFHTPVHVMRWIVLR